MKYQAGDYVAIHQSPVWRDRSDFLFRAHIGSKDGKNEWEQLWGQRVEPLRLRLCCIPFFADGLNLGDELEIDESFVFLRVLRHSTQTAFRVWFGENVDSQFAKLCEETKNTHTLMEWSSEHLLALSVEGAAEAKQIANYLQDCESQGFLEYDSSPAR